MKRWSIVAVGVSILFACASTSKTEWRKAGLEPGSEAMREQRSKDLADCTARAGAPTQGVQSTMSYSRAQVGDCMRARGWRDVPVGD